MKLTRSNLIKMIKEELYNPQSDDADFSVGIIVKDVNPDCPHHNSLGTVTEVSGDDVTYEVENLGKNYRPGDVLTKTREQLIPMKSENIKSLSESKLRTMIRKAVLSEAAVSSPKVAKMLSFEIVDQLYLNKHIKMRSRAVQELIFNVLSGAN